MTEVVVDVGASADFPDGAITAVEAAGQALVIVRQGGEVFALPDRCTHARYPLNDGELLDGKIKCIHHGASFDLHSGRPTLPAVKPIKLYQAAERDGRVLVAIQEA